MIYGIDFLIHDIPIQLLTVSESVEAYEHYFLLLKACSYPLNVVICDDISTLKIGLKRVFPEAQIQLCHTHYIENIRQRLHIRTEEIYRHFFYSLIKRVFVEAHSQKERDTALHELFISFAQHNTLLQSILLDIAYRQRWLFMYQSFPVCPKTNNIIESFNSHLQGRLKTIKGFQSFASADLWLNAYFLRRRIKPFTDCKGQFKKYNGSIPLQNSIKPLTPFPKIPGFQDPKTER